MPPAVDKIAHRPQRATHQHVSQSGRISTRMLLCQPEALKRDLARGGVLSAHVVNTPQAVEHCSSFTNRRFVIEKISGTRKNAQRFS